MITGNHILLRAVEETDLAQLLEWRNNPDLRKYFREFRELNHTMQLKWFNERVNNDPSTRMFSIVEIKTNKLIGACGLCYIDWINKSADFSIYIGKDELYIDDVFSLDAAKLLIAYGFEELNLHRLWSEIYDFDIKKKDFFNKLNFDIDGVFRESHWHDNKWNDSLIYSLLNKK